MADQVADAARLLRYALAHGITVQPDVSHVIGDAENGVHDLASDEPRRQAFHTAYRSLMDSVKVCAFSPEVLRERARRMRPKISRAHLLLDYAARTGRTVPADLREPLLIADQLVSMELASVDQETSFDDAYGKLTALTLPVTGETLLASKTNLGMTWGRVCHGILFVLVLIGAAVGISYQDVGENAMRRWRETDKELAKMQDDQALLRDSLNSKLADRDDAMKQATNPRRALIASDAASAAQQKLERHDQNLAALTRERKDLPRTLVDWSREPCSHPATGWLCGKYKGEDLLAPSAMTFEAQAMIDRMNKVVLPMILGLLGAYCFVLRTMTREIAEEVFSVRSWLDHAVRLLLGAMAGVGVGWFLSPQQVGLGNTVPVWTLAFLAGYAIDVLFGFMDRVASGFAAKNKPPT